MANVKKLSGSFPETVQIKNTRVTFGENGIAIVPIDIAKVFQQIPGYAVSGLEEVEITTSEVQEIAYDSEEQEEQDLKDLEASVAPDVSQTKRTSKKATPKSR